jgi:hypothetical protein
MALTDYRKLCPRSGHALTIEEREALGLATAAGSRARSVRCEACGRTVGVRPDPATGTSLLYSMHLRAGVESAAGGEGSA